MSPIYFSMPSIVGTRQTTQIYIRHKDDFGEFSSSSIISYASVCLLYERGDVIYYVQYIQMWRDDDGRESVNEPVRVCVRERETGKISRLRQRYMISSGCKYTAPVHAIGSERVYGFIVTFHQLSVPHSHSFNFSTLLHRLFFTVCICYDAISHTHARTPQNSLFHECAYVSPATIRSTSI